MGAELKIKRLISNMLFGKNVFVSYPKSGRTWMRYVLQLANVDVRLTHAGSGHGLKEIGEDFTGVDQRILGRRNVFMHRNPLDTAVSMHFETLYRSLHPSAENYSQKFNKLQILNRLPTENIEDFVLDGIWGIKRVCKFNKEWLDFIKKTTGKDFHVMSYETVKLNPDQEIERLLYFFGASTINIADIVKKTQFEEMKKLELSLSGPVTKIRLGMQVQGEPESMKVRRGKIGGYREYLSPKIIEECKIIAASYGFEI